MEEAKTEVKEERTTISAEVLEEVLLRVLGAYIFIEQLLQFFSILGVNGKLYFQSPGLLLGAVTHFAVGIFLIVAAGKWIKLTRFLRKSF